MPTSVPAGKRHLHFLAVPFFLLFCSLIPKILLLVHYISDSSVKIIQAAITVSFSHNPMLSNINATGNLWSTDQPAWE